MTGDETFRYHLWRTRFGWRDRPDRVQTRALNVLSKTGATTPEGLNAQAEQFVSSRRVRIHNTPLDYYLLRQKNCGRLTLSRIHEGLAASNPLERQA